MPQHPGKKKKKKVDVGTTASRVGGSMGRKQSAAQKLLRSGNPIQKFRAAQALIRSKSKKGGRVSKRKKD